METVKGFRPLCGLIVFMLLTTVSGEGQTCEAPSSPRCFRRKTDDTVYRCEWHSNTTDSRVRYDLFFECPESLYSKKKFAITGRTWYEIKEEQLIQYEKIDIWVEAHIGNAICTSSRWSAVLNDTVKYNAPENISLSWSKTKLTLRWGAVENFPAEAEVRYRRMIDADGMEWWTYWMANTTTETSDYRLTVVNLLKDTAYQVQIRHLNRRARNPLWSDWSSLVTVPAELEQFPEVSHIIKIVNGTRSVTLTWKPVPHAAAVSGVTYTARIMFPGGCPCKDKQHSTQGNSLVVNVSYTAVSILLRAKNAASYSPNVTKHIPDESISDLRACKNISLDDKNEKRTCLQLYELQDGDQEPKEVITLTAERGKRQSVKNFTRYIYFKHRCHGGKPQTVKMCLFYHKEGVPVSEPSDLGPFGETHNSVNLSWKAIPLEKLQGFLTHYNVCVRMIHPQEKPEVCRSVAEWRTNYKLENLTPGAKYNITLAGATRKGEGPKASTTINTLPEKHQEIKLPLILSLLFAVVLILPISTWIFTRLKSTILPPVPTPVILNFTPCRSGRQMIERKEEMDELMLQQLHSEHRSGPRDTQETTILGGGWDTDKEGDTEGRSDSRLSGGPGDDSSADPAAGRGKEAEVNDLEQVDNEIAMLIYRNGLVFDMKTDLP